MILQYLGLHLLLKFFASGLARYSTPLSAIPPMWLFWWILLLRERMAQYIYRFQEDAILWIISESSVSDLIYSKMDNFYPWMHSFGSWEFLPSPILWFFLWPPLANPICSQSYFIWDWWAHLLPFVLFPKFYLLWVFTVTPFFSCRICVVWPSVCNTRLPMVSHISIFYFRNMCCCSNYARMFLIRPWTCTARDGGSLGHSVWIFIRNGCNHLVSGFWDSCIIAPEILLAIGSACRVPERWMPGRFDYFGASHQVLHVCVVLATLANYKVCILV